MYLRILASLRKAHRISMTVFPVLILAGACQAQAQSLTFVEALFSEQGIPSLEETGAGGDVRVSPDRRHVYFYGGSFSYRISGQFFPAKGGIGVFSRDSQTGKLTFVDAIIQGIDVDYLVAVGEIDISPDGHHVYVPAGFDLGGSRDLLVYERDDLTGTLTLVESVANRGGLAVAVSQDGRHVYVLNGLFWDFKVLIFSRNENDGTVQIVDAIPATVQSLDRPDKLIVSQDGRNVYVLIFEGRIITLVRDQVTGTLEQSQVITLGSNLTTIVASRDGRHVYAGSNTSGGPIFALERNALTGQLTLVGQTPTQRSSEELAISPDGSEVYVNKGVEVFVRNAVTGALTSAQIFTEGVDGVVGIRSTGGLDVSSDGQNVYVIGSSHEDPASLAVFQRVDAPAPPGTVQFAGISFVGNESGGKAQIVVSRIGNIDEPASVANTTKPGTAMEGVDYLAVSGRLEWSAGDGAVKTFEVPLIRDVEIEPDEVLELILMDANGGVVLGSPSISKLRITDSGTRRGAAFLQLLLLNDN